MTSGVAPPAPQCPARATRPTNPEFQEGQGEGHRESITCVQGKGKGKAGEGWERKSQHWGIWRDFWGEVGACATSGVRVLLGGASSSPSAPSGTLCMNKGVKGGRIPVRGAPFPLEWELQLDGHTHTTFIEVSNSEL